MPPPPAYREAARPPKFRDLRKREPAEALTEPPVGWPSATKAMSERVENRLEDFNATRRFIERADLRCVQSDHGISARSLRVGGKEDSRRTAESISSRPPQEERLVTGPMQRRPRSRQTERDHRHRTRGWIDKDQYCFEEGPNGDARPVASDPRFRHPETAPRLSSRPCGITDVPWKRRDQLGNEGPSQRLRQGDSRIRDQRREVPRKMEEGILLRVPGKGTLTTASTQGLTRSRQPEQNLGRRVRGWSGEDREDPYGFDRGQNRVGRPSEPRFRQPETAPRPSTWMGGFTEIPRKKTNQSRHGRFSHPPRPEYSQIRDRDETELSSGSEPEPVITDDRWASVRSPGKLYRKALANWQPDSHRLSPRRRHSPRRNQGGTGLWILDPAQHRDRFDATLGHPRKRTVELPYSDRLGWSSISEMESSDEEEAKRPIGKYSQRKWRPEIAPKPPTKEKRDMKLEKFDGSVRVESFLAKFEICARHNRWREADRMDNLQCALTGDAAQILWDMGAEGVKTSSDLIRQLQTRYGSANQTALYRTQLKFRKRQKGETLADLVSDVRRLIVLAYPGPSSSMKEAFACEAFLEALNDRDMALKIREKEPPTLEEAYQFAMRLEAYAGGQGCQEKDRRIPQTRLVTETAPTPDPSYDRCANFLRDWSQLQQENFQKLMKEVKTYFEKSEKPPAVCPTQANSGHLVEPAVRPRYGVGYRRRNNKLRPKAI